MVVDMLRGLTTGVYILLAIPSLSTHIVHFKNIKLHSVWTQPELEDFQASETGGRIQGKDHYKDTNQVKEILEMQTKLKELTNDYISEHHKPDTADLSDIF